MNKKEKMLLWLELHRDALNHNQQLNQANSNVTLSLIIGFSGVYFGLVQLVINFQTITILQKEIIIALTLLFAVILVAIIRDHMIHWRINRFGIRYAQGQINKILKHLKVIGGKNNF